MDMKVHGLCDEAIDWITLVRQHCDNGTRDIAREVIGELRDTLADLDDAIMPEPKVPHVTDTSTRMTDALWRLIVSVVELDDLYELLSGMRDEEYRAYGENDSDMNDVGDNLRASLARLDAYLIVASDLGLIAHDAAVALEVWLNEFKDAGVL